MRPDRVVQQGLRTPTVPSFGSCCIRGIHGLRIGIHEAIERPSGVVFRCDLTASDANRWLEIPAWMFDRSACAKMRLAVEPHTDLSALVMLGVLLRDVRNKRSTALDAADSSVSPLPGDHNRGETHATPEQTEVVTPMRAAANRSVRRERATLEVAQRWIPGRHPQFIDFAAGVAGTCLGMLAAMVVHRIALRD